MRRLLESFSGGREMASPSRIQINNPDDFFLYINKYNGIKKKIYFSLYDKEKNINLIAFDFDDDNSINNLKKLHNYCKEKNILHLLTFSTRGFWAYIFTKNFKELNNKKDALKNSQLYVLKQAGIDVKEVDTHILGDINRVSRAPLSFDVGRKRFCIPVNETDLSLGYDYICKKSEQQINKFEYYGKELFDIKEFDRKCDHCLDMPVLNYDTKLLIEKDNFLKKIPPCMSRLLIKGDAGWRERYELILYLKEAGYLRSEVEQILKQFLTESKWKHCIIEERQVQYLFARGDLLMTSCDKLKEEGICVQGCSKKVEAFLYK